MLAVVTIAATAGNDRTMNKETTQKEMRMKPSMLPLKLTGYLFAILVSGGARGEGAGFLEFTHQDMEAKAAAALIATLPASVSLTDAKNEVIAYAVPLFSGPVSDAVTIRFKPPEGRNVSFDRKDFFCDGYQRELCHPIFSERDGDKVKILNRTFGGVWFDTQDWKTVVQPVTFLEQLAKQKFWQFNGYDGYRLRKTPDVNGAIVARLDEKKHVLRFFTGKFSGPWAEVSVARLKKPVQGCYSEEDLSAATGAILTGWIKAVRDDGSLADLTYLSDC
jgi:hypothetical protein